MKLGKLFFGLVLSSLMAVGVGIGIGSGNKEVKAAEAAGSTRRFFLDCTQHSGYDSEESIGIQYYTGSYIKKECTQAADNYWYVDVPSTNLTKVQFFRCDKGNVNKNYNWQWEGDPSGVNYYSVKGWDNNGDWSNADGADETYETASTTPSTTTKRVWVDPQNHFYDSYARAGLRVFNGDTYYKTYILGGSSQWCAVGSEAYIFYVDIPVNYDCQLVRLHNVFNIVWSYGHNITPMDGYNTTKIVYQWTANIGEDYRCSNESDPTVEYAKKVLDGYSTCVNSDVNGYAAYSEINTNILSKLTAAELSELRSSTFSAGTYGLRTYGEKIDYMANGGKAPSSLTRFLMLNKAFGENTGLTMIVIITSIATVSAFAGYFFYKKKKEDK